MSGGFWGREMVFGGRTGAPWPVCWAFGGFGEHGFLSSGRRAEVSHSDQVVDRRAELEHPADQVRPSVSRLAHQPDCLIQPKTSFDTLAFLLTHGVTGMTRGPAVDGTGAIDVVLRDVRVTPSPGTDERSLSCRSSCREVSGSLCNWIWVMDPAV